MRIVEVVIPDLISNKLDVKLSYPRIDTALEGLAGNPGRWVLKMQDEMLKSLLDNELPRLLVPVPDSNTMSGCKLALATLHDTC